MLWNSLLMANKRHQIWMALSQKKNSFLTHLLGNFFFFKKSHLINEEKIIEEIHQHERPHEKIITQGSNKASHFILVITL